MSPSIAIIGAGPAGLTLARLLSTASRPTNITIFELDASPTDRLAVGGTLDLHYDTGLAALRAGGLFDEFCKYARYDGDALVIADKHAVALLSMAGDALDTNNKDARPEIDREKLKEILLKSVPPGLIKWAQKLKAVTEDNRLAFDGGQTAGPFDLIVGADGAWSKVRHVLTEVRPTYSGICGFELRIPHPNEDYPEVSKMIGEGSYFTCGDRKSLIGQRMGDTSIKLSSWAVGPDTTSQDLLSQYGQEGVKQKILERHVDWDDSLLEWIRVSDAQSIKPWILYELPVGHSWNHRKGATLIGDAAHLMTPFAGEGVNAAMRDALELAEKISAALQNDEDLDEAVLEYEKDLFPRAKYVQTQTMRNKTFMFREDAPLGMVEMLTDVVEERFGELSWVAWVGSSQPVYALLFSFFWAKLNFGRWWKRWVGRKR